MSNIRDLGHKIDSLRNMQKVTRAMNMISSIKLRKLYAVQAPLGVFHKKTEQIKDDVTSALKGLKHPAVSGFDSIEKVHLVMFTADKGLCGTHNSSVQKAVEKFVRERSAAGVDVEITGIGRKGSNFCRRKGLELFRVSETGERNFTKNELYSISDEIFQRFVSGKVQEIYVAGNLFYSALRQETEIQQLLPLTVSEEKDPVSTDMQVEPDGEEFITAAASLCLKYKLYAFLMNSLLSEHSSRMTAMENATNNSEDLINKYVTMQNHARQAAITNELIEIVSGKEALKG